MVFKEYPPEQAKLRPQPLLPTPPPAKTPQEIMKEELEMNKTRISFIREMMVEMKDQIKKCTCILKKELGKLDFWLGLLPNTSVKSCQLSMPFHVCFVVETGREDTEKYLRLFVSVMF